MVARFLCNGTDFVADGCHEITSFPKEVYRASISLYKFRQLMTRKRLRLEMLARQQMEEEQKEAG